MQYASEDLLLYNGIQFKIREIRAGLWSFSYPNTVAGRGACFWCRGYYWPSRDAVRRQIDNVVAGRPVDFGEASLYGHRPIKKAIPRSLRIKHNGNALKL